MMTQDDPAPYKLMDDDDNDTSELTDSCEERKCFTIAGCRITEYQFDKLKLITFPILSKNSGALRDAKTVSDIYELLKIHYDGDAASTLCILLEKAGVNLQGLPKSFSKLLSPESDVLSADEFQWRLKLVQVSDRARKHKSVPKLVDHLYEAYDIDVGRESFQTPIALFEHMIEKKIFKPGDQDHAQDLKKVEVVFNWWSKISCIHVCLVVAKIIFLLGVVGFLLSFIKFVNIIDLERLRTVYFNGNVTVLSHVFDLRFYGEFKYRITPHTSEIETYEAFVCQTKCDGNIQTMLPMFFNGEVNTEFDTRCYLRFPGLDYPKIPALFMLEGSTVGFSFTPILDTPSNSTVSLHIFYSANNCMKFNNGDESISPNITLPLTQTGGFMGTFNSTTDDFVCVIVELMEGSTYNFTVNATVRQYQNFSYLNDHNLCDLSIRKQFKTDEVGSINQMLYRPSKAIRAVHPQPTCLLISFHGAPFGSDLATSSVVFGTAINIGMISFASLALTSLVIVVVLFVTLCMVCYKSQYSKYC